jgi:hypothetical protein
VAGVSSAATNPIRGNTTQWYASFNRRFVYNRSSRRCFPGLHRIQKTPTIPGRIKWLLTLRRIRALRRGGLSMPETPGQIDIIPGPRDLEWDYMVRMVKILRRKAAAPIGHIPLTPERSWIRHRAADFVFGVLSMIRFQIRLNRFHASFLNIHNPHR